MSHDRRARARTSSRSSTSTPADLERCLELGRAGEGRPLARPPGADRRRARAAGTSRCCSRSRRCARASTFEIAVRELGGHVVGAAAGRRRSGSASRSPTSRATSSAGSTRSSSARSRSGCSRSSPPAAPRLHVINALTDEEHPVPGARRLPDAAGALGHAARPHDRVRRRRQQRRDVARARRRRCSACTSTSPARTATSCRTPSCSRRRSVARHGARLRLFTDAADAVAGADAVYTDTWTSMGQEARGRRRGAQSSRRIR